MSENISRVVIVGGGAAGWITAGVIAAQYANSDAGVQVTLIESPDISTIGVGEGTWPSMRTTLEKMQISETDFFRECDASFKQGSKFKGWVGCESADEYYHPFTLPGRYRELNLVRHWLPYRDKVSFADAVCVQSHICEKNLAPKQISTAEYVPILNYGYHLDAGKFSTFLHRHCVEKLGVHYIKDNVIGINNDENEYIASLRTQVNGDVYGDLFIDCSGLASLLLGQHYKVPFISKKQFLFNDTALAVQVPYSESADTIASCTLSTAQDAGWIWDIGLPSRRGVGHVFSSAHIDDDKAELALRDYIAPAVGRAKAEELSVRKIKMNPGHREIFWYKNCVAVGMAAGFIEPLEASALVLVELAAAMISEQLPANRAQMTLIAKRYNDKFNYRWSRIIDFLKLHYVLSKKTDLVYWRDNCDISTIPQGLQELLELWQYQIPWHYDENHADEMFPSASFQYILYGMKFDSPKLARVRRCFDVDTSKADAYFRENMANTTQLAGVLLPNRELIEKIKKFGMQKI